MEASLPRRCSGRSVTLQNSHKLRGPAGTRGCLSPQSAPSASPGAAAASPQRANARRLAPRAPSISVCHTPTPAGRTAPLQAAPPGSRFGPPLSGTAEPVLPGHCRAQGGKRRPTAVSPLPSRSASAPHQPRPPPRKWRPRPSVPSVCSTPGRTACSPRSRSPLAPARTASLPPRARVPLRTDLLGSGRRHLFPPPPLRRGRARPLRPLAGRVPAARAHRAAAGRSRAARCPAPPPQITVPPPSPRQPLRHHRGFRDPRTRPSPGKGTGLALPPPLHLRRPKSIPEGQRNELTSSHGQGLKESGGRGKCPGAAREAGELAAELRGESCRSSGPEAAAAPARRCTGRYGTLPGARLQLAQF